jgi:hypothetical protein
MKVCTVCKAAKELTEFYTVKQRGVVKPVSHCKDCNRIRDMHPRNRWSRMRAQCRKYGIEFTVTRDWFVQMLNKGCHYCQGTLLDNSGGNMDRIDRTKGYTPENVLPCCWLCNSARGVIFTVMEMERIAAMFADFRRIRAEKGEPPLQGPQKWTKPEGRKRMYGRLIERERAEVS